MADTPTPSSRSEHHTVSEAIQAVNKRAGRDIFIATGVGIGLLAVVGASLIWLPWAFVLLIAAAMVGAQLEFGQALARQRGVKIQFVPLLIGSVLFIEGAYAAQSYPEIISPVMLVGVIGLTVIAVALIRLFGTSTGYITDVSSTLFLLLYPCLLGAGVMFMLAEEQGSFKVIIFVAGVAAVDIGGYFFGIFMGKHPMAPTISPKKSWEGALGSVLFSSVVVIMLTIFIVDQAWWKGLVLAFVIVISAIFGDLVESVIKRDLGIKDMSSVIPGHGGIMDRVDSYILSAIPAWLIMVWLFG
ncbi:MAG: phosphatidate cytidylyltransferase [Propionibacteriaceae bacterium]|nr:phosphatidate cytidylyltransferase [Propionibacteriaceae bacterium]